MSSKLRKIAKRRDGTSKGRGKGPVLEIRNDAQFETRVLQAEQPVVVDFWAPWCAPCRAMAPAFEAAAGQLAGRVVFAKVDTEASPALAQRFNIRSLPTLLVFDGGEIIDSKLGATSAGGLQTLAQRALDKHNGVGALDKVKRLFGGTATATQPST